MSLATLCRSYVDSKVRQRGDSYFVDVLVSVVNDGPCEAEFEVSNDRGNTYDVLLDWSDSWEGVYCECSCPHYDQGEICKHIWAAIRTADEVGLTADVPEHGDWRLIHAQDEDDDDFPMIVEALSDQFQRSLQLIRSGERRTEHTAKQTGWRGELSRVSQVGRQHAPGHSLFTTNGTVQRTIFLLDIAASAENAAIVIEIRRQNRLKNGGWGKAKEWRPSRTDAANLTNEDDRTLVSALFGNKSDESTGYNYWDYRSETHCGRFVLSEWQHEGLIKLLCETGRTSWVLTTGGDLSDAQPLAWDDGPPWRYRLRATADHHKKQWRLAPELHRGDEVLPREEWVLLLPHGILTTRTHAARLEIGCDHRWVAPLLQSDEIVVPFADRADLLSELWRFGSPPEIVGDAEQLSVTPTPANPQPRLRVHPAQEAVKNGARGRLYGDVQFNYPGRSIAADAPDMTWLVDDGARIECRDTAAEETHLLQLQSHGVVARATTSLRDEPCGAIEFGVTELPRLVDSLVNSGWIVEAEGALIRSAGGYSASVHSGVDWFDLETAIDFDGVDATLPQLLQAAKSGTRFVELGDGTRGLLPQDWLDRVAPMLDLAEVQDGKLRFKPSQALLLDAMLSAQGDASALEVDEQFRAFRDRLASFAGVEPANAPAEFRGELRPYQEEGLGWLQFLDEFRLGGCLADDMGLGKTVQVLALLAEKHAKRRDQTPPPSLAVVPKSLIYNWQAEAERFAPDLRTLDYTGLDRKRRLGDWTDHDLILTTYGTLRRDIAELKEQQFEYAILDEAQAIKNHGSQAAKACRLLRARQRLAMTGTPVENHLGELWSLFEFLNPGMLGRSSAFQATAKKSLPPERLDVLRRGLAPFLLRRTKAQVLKDLPEKNEQTLVCELGKEQRRQYDELRDHYRASLVERIAKTGINRSKIQVLEALLRLRQAACHPGLIDDSLVNKPSAKLDLLFEQLTDVLEEGHKALVFSQFTSLLALVRERLDGKGVRYEYLDGRTRKRQERVERFQQDADCPLFLISLKAGGVGLNLTAADYVFLLDPWWNPAVEAQAIDRAHRIGQTRPVFAYRVIAKDTVEEKILELQAQKKELADAIVSADKNLLSSLSAEDLNLLLS